VPIPARRGLAVLLATGALSFFCGFYVLFLPLAPAAASRTGSAAAVGAFGMASLLGRPVAGRLVDRLGPRIALACGGALLAASAVSPAAIARAVLGLAYVAFSTGLGASVARAAPAGARVVALGWSGVPANAAMALAPALVGLGTAALTPSALAAALGLSSSAVALALPRAAAQPDLARRAPGCGHVPASLLALAGASGVEFAAFAQLAPVALGTRTGAAFAAYGGAMIAARLCGVPLAAHGRAGLPGAFLAAASGLLALAVLPPGAAAVAAPLLVAAGLALQHPAILALHVAARPLSSVGTATAGFYVGFDLGIALGGAALSLALDGLGPRGAFLIAAGVAVTGALVARFEGPLEPHRL
jgi:predicted MFS family arabinose efflux permease